MTASDSPNNLKIKDKIKVYPGGCPNKSGFAIRAVESKNESKPSSTINLADSLSRSKFVKTS